MNIKNTKSADYEGVEGLPTLCNTSEIVLTNIYASSTLGEVSNPMFGLEKNGKGSIVSANYILVDDIDPVIYTRHQTNGEVITDIPSPFSSGSVPICHEIKYTKKYGRTDAINMGEYWTQNQEAMEKIIARHIMISAERFGYQSIIAGASSENTGNEAGYNGAGIRLGDSVRPLYVNPSNDNQDFNVTASEVINRLSLAMELSKGMGEMHEMRVVASPTFLSNLRKDQNNVMIGGSCCLEDKPLISGVIYQSWGFPILSSHNLPRLFMSDGTLVEYVALINRSVVAAPIVVDYVEWEKQGHDINLLGSARFNSKLLVSRGVAVAAVKYKP